MKKIIYIFVFSLLTILPIQAGEYPSFHQMTGTKGLIDELKKMINDPHGILEQDTYFTVYGEAEGPKEQWCEEGFQRIKVYIPAGLKKVFVGILARPNSSYFILGRFVPSNFSISSIDWTKEQNIITDHDLTSTFFTTVTNGGSILEWWHGAERYYTLDVTKFQGGWLYIHIIQASKLMYSYSGHVNRPSIQFIVGYYYDPKYKQEFDNWLKNTKFNPQTGDPIDGFSSITEEVRYCSDFGKKENIHGVADSDVTGYELFYGIQRDPNLPSLTLQSSTTTPRPGTDIIYTAKVEAGKQALEGIQVEVNQNITTGVLLQEHLDSSCLSYRTSTISDQNIGQVIYSDNGQNWYDNPLDDAIKGNIRYIGYLINAPLSASGSAQLDVKATIDPSCTGSLNVNATLGYSLNSVEKTETKQSILSLQTGSTSTGGSYTPPPTYTPPSSSTGGGTTTTGGKTQAQIYCEDHGGTWADGTCLSGGTGGSGTFFYTQSSSSSSSQVATGDKSQDQIYCEDHGGTWADGTCLSGSDESSSSSSSSVSIVPLKDRIIQVVKKLTQKVYPVEGYFAQFGKGAFDWIYLSNTGNLYKLEGMDNKGHLQWISLTPYFSEIKFENGKLFIGSKSLTRDIDVRVSSVLREIEDKQFEVAGYFVHYDSGAFDWVLRTQHGLYKLDGMRDDGSFDWKPLGSYFKKIELQDYESLIIGEAKIEEASSSSAESSSSSSSEDSYLQKAKANCQAVHGNWDDEKMICVVKEEGSSESAPSQQSSSMSSSSSSSSHSTQSVSSSDAFPSISQ